MIRLPLSPSAFLPVVTLLISASQFYEGVIFFRCQKGLNYLLSLFCQPNHLVNRVRLAKKVVLKTSALKFFFKPLTLGCVHSKRAWLFPKTQRLLRKLVESFFNKKRLVYWIVVIKEGFYGISIP